VALFSFPDIRLHKRAAAALPQESALLLAACSATPSRPDSAESLRTRLTRLRADPALAKRVPPLAMKEADVAVTAAERPHADKAVATHLVYMADRKISIAEAQAQSRLEGARDANAEARRKAEELRSQQQKAAISVWEDEGGSTAAPRRALNGR
jgi:hypothetical protein